MFSLVPNRFLDAFCVFIVALLVFYNYSRIKRKRPGTGYLLFVVVILSYSLFYRPIEGDFWHYLEFYELGANYNYLHMEEFYYRLMNLIPDNYLLWRLFIWLPAAILIALVFRSLRIQSSYATVFFLLFGLSAYYYTRNALALSFLYLGMAVLCRQGSSLYRLYSILLFIGLTVVSWFLHRSMPIYIMIALLAVVLPFNRKYILAAMIAFPILYGIVLLIASDFLNVAGIWLSSSLEESYLESVNTFYVNWKGALRMIIGFTPFIYFYIIAFLHPIPKELADFVPYKVFLLFSFFVFFVSFLFLGQGSIAIQGRLYRSTMIPFSFTVALYFKYYFGTRRCNTFIYLVLFYYATELFLRVVG